MFGAFKERLADLQAAGARFRDKETAEAIVAVMTGVAFADGELEEAEQRKLAAAFQHHPILSQFDTAVLTDKFDQLVKQFSLDTDLGLSACLKELKDIARRAKHEQKIIVMQLGLASAKADGEIEPAERAFLARCADSLGVRLAEIGL
jgi:tellurite resistance protein TerB